MADFGRLILRFLAIAFGYFVAALFAGISYVFLTGIVRPEDFGAIDPAELTFTLIVSTIGVASIMGRAALLPALVIIAAFEFFKRRDWLSHALAGGVIGAGLGAGAYADGADFAASRLAIHMACGIIAASVYWFLIGRNAGYWLPSERERLAAERQRRTS